MRIRFKIAGGHVHCRCFTAGKNGDLCFGIDEWPDIKAAFVRAGFILIEEES